MVIGVHMVVSEAPLVCAPRPGHFGAAAGSADLAAQERVVNFPRWSSSHQESFNMLLGRQT